MQKYRFKYQTGKGGGYFLRMFYGAPSGLMIPNGILVSALAWIFWITIPLMITILVYCIRKFIGISKGTDVIQLDAEGFRPAVFGHVDYGDIQSIPPFNAFQVLPASMRIKLRNGRKPV